MHVELNDMRSAYKIHGISTPESGVGGGIPMLELNITTFQPADSLKRPAKFGDAMLCLGIIVGVGHEDCDAPHSLGWLRSGSEGPYGHAAK